MCFKLPAWKTLRSSPTGRPPLCSALILWRVSPLIRVCCLQRRGRLSSPVRTRTSPACLPSFPTKATVEHRPHTDTAQVTTSTCSHTVFDLHSFQITNFSVVLPSEVRQVFSPGLLSNFQLLDGPPSHSLNSPYNPTISTWSSSPLSKTPLHSHTPTSLYTPGVTPSFTTSSPSREGRESPRLQEALKAERLSPLGGLGASSSSFLNLTPAAGGLYTPSSHSHMLSPYSSYMGGPQDYSSAALYSGAGAWISPSYSPKLRNKIRATTPGEAVNHNVALKVWFWYSSFLGDKVIFL